MKSQAIFYGQNVALYAGPLGFVEMSDHRAHEVIPMHRHGLAYARFCIDGAMIEIGGKERTYVNAGDVTNHPDDCQHANKFGAKGGRMMSFMPSLALRRIFGIRGVSSAEPWLRHDWPEVANANCCGPKLLVELCRNWSRGQPKPQHKWSAIAEDLAQSEQSAGSIAAAHGMSPSSFSRKFAVEFGLGPGQYRLLKRVQRAIDDVVDSGCTWTTAAHEAGFADSSHFNRAFRRIVGAPPSRCL